MPAGDLVFDNHPTTTRSSTILARTAKRYQVRVVTSRPRPRPRFMPISRAQGTGLNQLQTAKGLSRELLTVAADVSAFTYRKLAKGRKNLWRDPENRSTRCESRSSVGAARSVDGWG